MPFFDSLKMVFSGLRARAGRSILTMIGIVIGVAGVIIIVALGAGAQSLVLGQITKLGTNIIGVLPGKSDETGPPAAVFGIQVTTLVNEDADALKDKTRFPHITAVAPFVRGAATVLWRGEQVDTNFTATSFEYPLVQNVVMESGRFFDDREDSGGSNVMVLGYDIKEQLFGDKEALGQIVKIKSVPFEVIGVVEKQGTVAFQNQDDQVFIPLVIGQKQLLGIKHLQFIRMKVDDAAYLKSVMADVTEVLKERHKIRNDADIDFSVRDLADAVKILSSITDGLRLFLVVMAAIALVVGGIGIMNIMLVTVAERTREIGLRKAVGAKNSTVRNQFLLESSLVTLGGGVVGIIVGSLISYVIAIVARYLGYDWAFVISPVSIILAVGVSILTGVVFGLYPAFKAARLSPVEALRYE